MLWDYSSARLLRVGDVIHCRHHSLEMSALDMALCPPCPPLCVPPVVFVEVRTLWCVETVLDYVLIHDCERSAQWPAVRCMDRTMVRCMSVETYVNVLAVATAPVFRPRYSKHS